MKNQKGFTLLELLIVIGIIAILGAIVYVAVDPARRFAEARNAQRWASVNSILNAYLNYTVDNRGTEPATLVANTYYMIGTTFAGCTSHATTAAVPATFATNLTGTYLASMPIDPKGGTAANTLYYIMKNTTGRIIVGSCTPEAIGGVTPVISVQR